MTHSQFMRETIQELATILGVPIDMDPSRVESPQPRLRLQLTGFEDQGENRELMSFTALLTASGDGPATFIDEVAAASRQVKPYLDGYTDIAPAPGIMARVTMERIAPGRFEENEEKFTYSYVEQFRLYFSYSTKHFD